MRALLTLPLLLTLAAGAPTHRYILDGAGSAVNARVAFFGLAHKTAHFPKLSGGISLAPDRLDEIALNVTLDARALAAGDRVTQERLRGPSFFDVERHPTVQFSGSRMTMTSPVTATIAGQVTARGITRPATLTVSFAQPPARATGQDPITLTARTTIDRRAFGMTAYSMVVGRKVTVTINARLVPA